MDEAQKLKNIDRFYLLHGDHGRQRGQDIEDEEAFEVGACDARQVAVVLGGDEKAEHNLHTPRDVVEPDEPRQLLKPYMVTLHTVEHHDHRRDYHRDPSHQLNLYSLDLVKQ